MKTLLTTLLLSLSIVAFSQNEKQTGTGVKSLALETSTEDAQAMQLFLKADNYFVKGKYKKAISYYKQAVAVDSNFIDAIDNIGTSYRRLFEMDSAIHYYKLSLSKMPNNKGVLYNLGLVYLYLEKYSEAETSFTKLLTMNKADLEASYHLSLTHLWSSDYTKAIEWGTKTYEQALSTDKILAADAVYIVCKALLETDKKNDAIAFYKRAKSKGAVSTDAAAELGL
jgi:tetratricopeptide (TPR) repeat protein